MLIISTVITPHPNNSPLEVANVGVTLARGRLYGERFLSFFSGLAAKYFIVSVAIRMASLPRVFFLARRLAFSVVRAMSA